MSLYPQKVTRKSGSWILVGLLLLLAACQPDAPKIAFDDVPEGDVERGAMLFEQSINSAPTCRSCHRLDDVRSTGPGLDGYGERARDAHDDPAEYTFDSIVRPAKDMVQGYSNLMYAKYDAKLSAQQIADLIAYLLTL